MDHGEVSEWSKAVSYTHLLDEILDALALKERTALLAGEQED